MTARDIAHASMIVGGFYWGLFDLSRFDLVSTLTGSRFGENNAAAGCCTSPSGWLLRWKARSAFGSSSLTRTLSA